MSYLLHLPAARVRAMTGTTSYGVCHLEHVRLHLAAGN